MGSSPPTAYGAMEPPSFSLGISFGFVDERKKKRREKKKEAIKREEKKGEKEAIPLYLIKGCIPH